MTITVPKLGLKASILYDDSHLAQLARENLRLIEEHVKEVHIQTIEEMDLTLLSQKGRSRDAVSLIVDADIVFVALNHTLQLPDPWRLWFWKWAQVRTAKRSVLLCLLGPAAADNRGSDLRKFFKEVARIGGLDFLCQSAEQVDETGSEDAWDFLSHT